MTTGHYRDQGSWLPATKARRGHSLDFSECPLFHQLHLVLALEPGKQSRYQGRQPSPCTGASCTLGWPQPGAHLALSRGSIMFRRWKLLKRSWRMLPSGCSRETGSAVPQEAAPGYPVHLGAPRQEPDGSGLRPHMTEGPPGQKSYPQPRTHPPTGSCALSPRERLTGPPRGSKVVAHSPWGHGEQGWSHHRAQSCHTVAAGHVPSGPSVSQTALN